MLQFVNLECIDKMLVEYLREYTGRSIAKYTKVVWPRDVRKTTKA